MTNTQLQDIAQSLKNAQEAGDKLAEAQAHTKLGNILLRQNSYQEAAQHYQQAIILFDKLELKKEQTQALNRLAVIKIMTQRPQEAIENLEAAQEIAKSINADTLQLAIYGNLGLAHAALGNYIKAVRFHKKVMDASLELEDKQMQLQAQINLADAYLQDKRPQQALGFALVAHDVAKELNATSALVMLLDLIGTIYSRQKDLRTAIDYHKQALDLAVEIGDPHRQAIALANKALAHEALTELESAHQSMTEAQTLFQMLNSEYAANTQKDLARIRRAINGKD